MASMSLVRSKILVTYSSPRSRKATSPKRRSGVGLALIISLAMDQIFCLAPSIKPLIEPVVSSTKQTSIRGFFSGASPLAKSAWEQAIEIARSIDVVFIWFGSVGDFVNGVVEREQDIWAK